MRLNRFRETLLVFLLTPLCFSQNHLFRKVGLEDGLTQLAVRSLFQDRDGYVWIGTRAGLCRYDGYQMKSFRVKDGLASDHLKVIQQDADGVIWLGTTAGLSSYKDNQFKNYGENEGIPNGRINDLLIEGDTIWIGHEEGLYAFSRKNETAKKTEGVPRSSVNAILLQNGQPAYVGTDLGLYFLVQDRYTAVPEMRNKEIISLMSDTETRVWAASPDGVAIFEDDTLKKIYETYELGGSPLSRILQDRFGVVWIGTHRGVAILDGDKITLLGKEQGLDLTLVNTFMEDLDGLIWIGGFPGVHIMTGRAITNWRDIHGLGSNGVRSLLQDSKGTVWAGTMEGLSEFRGDHWVNYGMDEGLPHPMVLSMIEDKQGKLWVGTRGGLCVIEDGVIRIDDRISRNVGVLSVKEDQYGVIWLSLREVGILTLKPDATEAERTEPPNNTFTMGRIFIDSQQRVWLSGDRGLSRLDTNGWRTFGQKDGLAADKPYFMAEDGDGRLWFGYHASHGVTVFDHQSFKTYTTADGLRDDAVFSVGVDRQNHVWMGTAHGADRYNGTQFVNYSPIDGLAGLESNAGAFMEDKDGNIWLGTMAGLSRFNPKLDPVVSASPRLRLDKITIGGIDMDYLKPGVTDHSHRDLEAHFAIHSFVTPERVEVNYRLKGYEDEWRMVKSNPIQVSNLSPANYTLELRMRVYEGPWSPSESYSFSIQPPWWRNVWFYVLACLVLVALLWCLYQYRMSNIKQRNELLQHQVFDRTRELEAEVRERRRAEEELVAAQRELVDQARQAGMSEIAVGVLHNIGNLISSVNTSASVILSTVEQSKIQGLSLANQLLRENMDDLDDFILNNPKGRQLLQYYLGLEDQLNQEQTQTVENTSRLITKIESIRNYITMHQSYAIRGSFEEHMDLSEIVEDALALLAGSISRHDISLEKNLNKLPKVRVQKTKLIHILINLFKNAKEAMLELPPDNRKMQLAVYQEGDEARLSVCDNGYGIDPSNYQKLFTQGFTTKSNGHGFGLHSCANYMTEMGGKIMAESEGINKGACFILCFSLPTERDSST